jgi:hypothetical protein
MISSIKRHALRARAAVIVFALGALAGCGTPTYDATPSADNARAGLDRALSAWKAGGKPGDLEGKSPVVHAVDSVWQTGRKLESFTIVSDEAGQPDRRFLVKLTYAPPAKEEEVHYVVVGKDPLWVYRDEDYARMINMDNNPSDKPSRGRRR